MIQAMLMGAKMWRNRMWQRAWCQSNDQTTISELLKSSSQSHAQWDELSRGPLCIWSRRWVSSGSRMWWSWLHSWVLLILSHHLYVFLTFRVISPQLYHLGSQFLVFIFTGIAHLTFMVLHLSSFSSPHYPVLIAYSSLFFHIFPSTTHDAILWVQGTYFGHVDGHPTPSILMWYTYKSLLWTHSFLYFRVVWLLLIFDIDPRVTFGDVLEGVWVFSVALEAFWDIIFS